MRNIPKFILLCILALPCAAQIDLNTQTKGTLSGARGGRGDTSNGVLGQVLIGDGAGHFAPGDPIVSFNYANLLNAQPATGQAAGSPVRLSTFGAAGTLYVTFAGITGSGTSCTVQLKNYDSLGNAINNGSPISVTPGNGTTSTAISPALALQTAAQMSATYACSGYPTGGTISVDFVPDVSVGIAGTVTVGGTVAVSNFPATQPISGSVSVSNFPGTQPVSGTITANAGTGTFAVSAASLPLPTGAAQDATLTGGTAKAIARGGAKGSSSAADVTSTASGVNHQGLDVAIYDAGGNQIGLQATPLRTDPTGSTTQPVSAASLPLPAGAATAAKQPALGTAGAASADVITVQGVASMTPVAISGTVTTTPPSNASTNVAQLAGTATSVNSGVKDAGTLRVVIATDQPALTNKLLVTPDSVALPANQSVNVSQVNGVTPLMGNGVTGTGSPRVTVASDNTPFTVNAAESGSWTVTTTPPANASTNVTQFGSSAVVTGTGAGGAGIPRVTVSNDSTIGLVAGSAIVGKVGIDQTTPGTTNGVQVNAALPAGTNLIGKAGFDATTPGITNGAANYQPAIATGTITTNASVVSISTVGMGDVGVTFHGTYAGITVNFEFSDDGGTTWYPNTCAPTNTSIQVSTTALATNATQAFDCGAYASTNFRVRSSAFSSGTANVGLTASAVSIEPAPTVAAILTDSTGAAATLRADNGVAAATDRLPVLPSIYQTSYLNGTAATQGRNGSLSQGTDGLLWTANLPAIRPASFSASATVASAASATDIAVMPGNASNTVLLTRVKVSCTQTTAGIITLNIIKRTTADSAGTSAGMTAIADDSNTSGAVSAPLSYTANPTINNTVGNVDTYKLGCMATGTASPNDIYILNRTQKPLVLRGTAQQIAVNLGGTTVTGGSFAITFEWIETSTITP